MPRQLSLAAALRLMAPGKGGGGESGQPCDNAAARRETLLKPGTTHVDAQGAEKRLELGRRREDGPLRRNIVFLEKGALKKDGES